jgi:hypothetical protein
MAVSVTINGSQRAFLVVDTGSAKTILSPALLDRLRIAISPNAARWTVRLVGGGVAVMLFVRVQSVQVGRLTVEELDVGVYPVFPTGAGVEGLLGADFLNRFRVTMGRTAGRLTLAVSPPSASPSAAPEEEARSIVGPSHVRRGWLWGDKKPELNSRGTAWLAEALEAKAITPFEQGVKYRCKS